MSLFTLRYREGNRGVVQSFVEASSLAKAEEVGRRFCDGKINAKFIKVEEAVIATEDILKPEPAPRATEPAAAADAPQAPDDDTELLKERTRAMSADGGVGVAVPPAVEPKPITSRPAPKRGNQKT